MSNILGKRDYVITLGGDFTPNRYGMFSGQGEAAQHRYDLHVGKSGRRWLVGTSEDRASNVYVEGGPGSQGFGGSELVFVLRDGETLALKGPWHSNADSLFKDTGVDVRNEHYTFGVIGTGREHRNTGAAATITGVIYADAGPTKGDFCRIDELAQRLADERQQTLYCYRESKGGSSCGPVNPRRSS